MNLFKISEFSFRNLFYIFSNKYGLMFFYRFYIYPACDVQMLQNTWGF